MFSHGKVMSTIPFPEVIKYRYPIVHYPQMTNLQRDTDYDRRQLIARVSQGSYNLNAQNYLVGLLKHLSIDPEWTLDYLIAHVRLHSHTLCSLFNITYLSNAGLSTNNVFYYHNATEHLCLIENDRQYKLDDLDITELYPVIPMYTDINTHSYVPSVEYQNVDSDKYKNKVAIIGIDMVELAIGWWLYMKQPRTVDTGISAYLVKYPLVNAQLIHNQLSIINVLYEHIVNDCPYSKILVYPPTKFITKDPLPKLNDYCSFLTTRLSSSKMVNIGHVMAYIQNIYFRDYPIINNPGKSSFFSMSCWAWDAERLKLYAIYLSVANKLFYRASDVNTLIKVGHKTRLNNYERIVNPVLRKHLIALATKVNNLNDENMN